MISIHEYLDTGVGELKILLISDHVRIMSLELTKSYPNTRKKSSATEKCIPCATTRHMASCSWWKDNVGTLLWHKLCIVVVALRLSLNVSPNDIVTVRLSNHLVGIDG